MLQTQCGINFNYSGNLMNEYIVGGMTKIFPQPGHICRSAGRIGIFSCYADGADWIRQQIFTNTYLTGKANILFNNFISTSKFFNYQDFYSGYALDVLL